MKVRDGLIKRVTRLTRQRRFSPDTSWSTGSTNKLVYRMKETG